MGRSLSDLVKENESLKQYNYKVIVEGSVTAHSEDQAGELVDKEMDCIEGLTNYEIVLVDQSDVTNESIQTLGLDQSVIAENVYNEILSVIENKTKKLTDYARLTVLESLRQKI